MPTASIAMRGHFRSGAARLARTTVKIVVRGRPSISIRKPKKATDANTHAKGRKAIRVRVTFEPVNRPLLPGMPPQESAWSEIDYTAHSWVEPEWRKP